MPQLELNRLFARENTPPGVRCSFGIRLETLDRRDELGKGIREFRSAVKDVREEVDIAGRQDSQPDTIPPAAPPVAPTGQVARSEPVAEPAAAPASTEKPADRI